MKPVDFLESNTTFGPPEGYDVSQVRVIKGYRNTIDRGNLEGDPIIVTCWELDQKDIEQVIKDKKIFICFLTSGLPPHCLAPTFNELFQE